MDESVRAKMQELMELRTARISVLNETTQEGDPFVNQWIADMINMLENMYVILNPPVDGFVSLTPKRDE
jgi:hypothetical protein